MYSHAKLSDLIGKTMISVVDNGDDEIVFITDKGEVYKLFHSQDCCESVVIDDITGDLGMLVGSPILVAEEATNRESNPDGVTKEYQDSFTWTFYKFATNKGWVDIRWYGESNGYYSESVEFGMVGHVKVPTKSMEDFSDEIVDLMILTEKT
jgi:hypothetical protein